MFKFALSLALMGFINSNANTSVYYPKVKKVDNVETRFGVEIYDPYKWMEIEDDPSLSAWLLEQDKLTQDYLRGEIYNKVKNDLRPQGQKSFPTIQEIIVEEEFMQRIPYMNKVSFDKEFHNTRYRVSMVSDTNNDLSRMTIFDKKTNSIKEGLRLKFGSLLFWEEENTFVYLSDRDQRLGGTHMTIFRHTVGTSQGADEVVYRAPTYDTWVSMTKLSDDKYYLFERKNDKTITRMTQFDLELNEKVGRSRLVPGTISADLYDDKYNYFFISYDKASNGELYHYQFSTSKRKLLIGEQDFVLTKVYPTKSYLYIKGQKDAANVIYRYNRASGELKQIIFPRLGSINVRTNGDGAIFSTTGYDHPRDLYAYDVESNQVTLISSSKESLNLVSKRHFYRSHNGKQVALWVTHKEGLTVDEDTPVYLYGYGGFRVSILPRYSSFATNWMKQGGVYAVATLPGGLEYGEDFHQAGSLLNKENVFDDFANAAKYLIDQRMTSPSKLAIGGGSNGGLLVTATMRKYPHLFKAAIPEVGVHDLLNYQFHTGGKWWIAEYGDALSKKHFGNLFKLSPYHNIIPLRYPSTLVMTSNFDDRVMPFHSYKYAARLQEHQKGDGPVLLHVTKWAGHSSRPSNKKERLKYEATKITFLIKELF